MKDLIEQFPSQLQEALDVSMNVSLKKLPDNIKSILIVGMGGSGIGAEFIKTWAEEYASVPVIVNKGYQIPAHIGENTISIISSYSGNTEETISAFGKVREKGAHVIILTSGGNLLNTAKNDSLDYIQLPGHIKSPRACLGYNFVQVLKLMVRWNQMPEYLLSQVNDAGDFLEGETEAIKEKTERLAGIIYGKTPVIYTSERNGPVAVRWRQQINENSKLLAWHHIIPEMNHNELVGWRDQRNDLAIIMLRDNNDHPRNNLRFDLSSEIISQYTNTVINIYAKGSNRIERALYLVYVGDWLSWYLAELHQVDAAEVKVIDYLKACLTESK